MCPSTCTWTDNQIVVDCHRYGDKPWGNKKNLDIHVLHIIRMGTVEVYKKLTSAGTRYT